MASHNVTVIKPDLSRIWLPRSMAIEDKNKKKKKRKEAMFEIDPKIRRRGALAFYGVRGKTCWHLGCIRKPLLLDYRYCSRHLKSDRHLSVKSTSKHLQSLKPPVVGKGLYAVGKNESVTFRKGALVDVYGGEVMTPEEIDARYAESDIAPYSIVDHEEDNGIDAMCASTAAAFANDPRGDPKSSANVASMYDDGLEAFVLLATRDIKGGEELLLDYGPEYWT